MSLSIQELFARVKSQLIVFEDFGIFNQINAEGAFKNIGTVNTNMSPLSYDEFDHIKEFEEYIQRFKELKKKEHVVCCILS